MYNYPIRIKKIPIDIKEKVIKYINQQSNIVGYKIILLKYKVPVIELSDYTRIWVFPNEISK